MSGELQVLTEPLGGSELTRALIAETAPAGWMAPRPGDPDAWRARVVAARGRVDPGWLRALEPAIAAGGAAAERLRQAAEHGVVVTTGQQPGLFGGPIYTWSKALSALALADALEAACGVPVAPLFWAATDDGDFAEAATTWVAMPGGAIALSLSRTVPDGTSMATAPLGDVEPALSGLEAAAGSAAYAESLIAVRAAYAPLDATPTVGGSFVALLRRMLEPLGIAVMDAGHRAVRAQAFPVLRQALGEAAAVDLSLRARDAELRAAGYEPQVALVPDLSLVFRDNAGIRSRIPVATARGAARDASPGELSWSVLLRPLVEQEIVPTIAYVAGPSELAYFAQTTAVATGLGRPLPLAVPRWAGWIIEPQAARALERFGLTIEDFRDPHAVEARFLHDHIPPEIQRALTAIAASVDSGFQALAATDRSQIAPPTVLDSARQAIHHWLEQLERRYMAGVRDAHRATLLELATLRGALFPGGVRQERRLNLIPTLARQGPAVFDAIRSHAAAHAATLLGEPAAR